MTKFLCLKIFGQKCEYTYSGKVVVAKRGMTDMCRQQHFVRELTGQKIFSIAQMTFLKCRVNKDFVDILFQLLELPVSNAESPILLVIGSAVRNPVRIFRQGVKMVR